MKIVSQAGATWALIAAIVGGTVTAMSFFATAADLRTHERASILTMKHHQLQQATDRVDDLQDSLKYDSLSTERRAVKERQLRYYMRQEKRLLLELTGEPE